MLFWIGLGNTCDMVINDASLRISLFPKTIPHTQLRNCSACHKEGNIRTSMQEKGPRTTEQRG